MKKVKVRKVTTPELPREMLRECRKTARHQRQFYRAVARQQRKHAKEEAGEARAQGIQLEPYCPQPEDTMRWVTGGYKCDACQKYCRRAWAIYHYDQTPDGERWICSVKTQCRRCTRKAQRKTTKEGNNND